MNIYDDPASTVTLHRFTTATLCVWLEVIEGSEGEFAEKVVSGAWNPCFGDKTTRFECFGFAVEEVDDVVANFWWEAGQSRGRQSVCFQR
jgi:hypothetical protein